MQTYTDKAGAIRGYLRANKECELSKEELKQHLQQDAVGRWAVVIPEPEQFDEPIQGPFEGPAEPAAEQPKRSGGAYKDVPVLRKSVEQGAVSRSWDVFSSQPEGTSRKDAIAAAVAAGVAFYTARTQYQKWKHREDGE